MLNYYNFFNVPHYPDPKRFNVPRMTIRVYLCSEYIDQN